MYRYKKNVVSNSNRQEKRFNLYNNLYNVCNEVEQSSSDMIRQPVMCLGASLRC